MTTSAASRSASHSPALPSPAALKATAPSAGLTDLLHAFRLMQLQHGRVIIHESESLQMGATDIRALFFISEGDQGATPKQVAEFLELSTGATTSLVDRLVNAGTLVREAHPTDRRSVVLQMTDAGHAAARQVADVYLCALGSVIPEESFGEMATLFRTIAGALTEGSGCFEPAPTGN